MEGGALWPHPFPFPRLPRFSWRRHWLLHPAIRRAPGVGATRLDGVAASRPVASLDWPKCCGGGRICQITSRRLPPQGSAGARGRLSLPGASCWAGRGDPQAPGVWEPVRWRGLRHEGLRGLAGEAGCGRRPAKDRDAGWTSGGGHAMTPGGVVDTGHLARSPGLPPGVGSLRVRKPGSEASA